MITIEMLTRTINGLEPEDLRRWIGQCLGAAGWHARPVPFPGDRCGAAAADRRTA